MLQPYKILTTLSAQSTTLSAFIINSLKIWQQKWFSMKNTWLHLLNYPCICWTLKTVGVWNTHRSLSWNLSNETLGFVKSVPSSVVVSLYCYDCHQSIMLLSNTLNIDTLIPWHYQCVESYYTRIDSNYCRVCVLVSSISSCSRSGILLPLLQKLIPHLKFYSWLTLLAIIRRNYFNLLIVSNTEVLIHWLT